jgi:serine/threonine protein kinase
VSGLIAGKYELVERVREGSAVWMGLTHGAFGFRRRVAIKRLAQNLEDDHDRLAEFLEEARIASELEHPNIVDIHDFDQDEEGRFFLVLEWIDGLDLATWARSFDRTTGPAPWPIAISVVTEVLAGLAAAHERLDESGRPAPVFHRDVSARNVLFGCNGIVKLGDFGAAKAFDSPNMTQPGVLRGQLRCQAPEVLSGEPTTERSDVYGAGLLAWEVLTGRAVFDAGDPAALITAILTAPTPSLAPHRPDLPTAVADVITRALSRDPMERPASARELRRALLEPLAIARIGLEERAASLRDARIRLAALSVDV